MSLLANPTLRLFVGATLISFSPVWVRLVDVPATTSGFYRAAIGGAALVIYLAATRRKLDLTRRVWWILAAASVFFMLDLWFWHRSIALIGPGLSTLLANFQVFFMLLAGFLIWGQRPTPSQLIAVPLAIVGLATIVGFDWRELPQDYRWGVILGLLTAVVYAGYLLTLRAARSQSKHQLPSREVAVISLACAAMLGLIALIEGASLAIPTVMDGVWLFSYGVLSHALGWMFIASSLPRVSAAEAGIALLVQPPLTFVWDVIFFNRPITALELAGAALALFAIYLGSRSTFSRTSETAAPP